MRRGAKPAKAKAKVEGKRPAARKPPKTDAARVRDLEMRLAEAVEREAEARKGESEALEQQTATSEILRVISQSLTDIQPVLDAVAASAARLCEAFDAAIWRRDGDRVVLVAHHGLMPEEPSGKFSLPLVGSFVGRSVLDGRTIHARDVQAEMERFPATSEHARRIGFRAVLCVPLMREGAAIGSIALRRMEAELFTDRQVSLLKTFADQAVIAIENVRLFTELQVRNADLTEALEQQTATAEILRVISSSPTDLQPVLVTVAENAARVCGAIDAQIYRVEGQFLHWVASHGTIPPNTEERLISRGWVTGRAVVDRQTIHVHDLAAESDTEYPVGKAAQRQTGHRTTLATPLLREGVPLGVISIRRMEVRPFSDNQVGLLKTFADQAVIAIENVRLFRELEARNRDLTATSDILRVISSSPTDVQPVFDTIVRSAVTLCDGLFSALFQFDGELLQLVAQHNFTLEALEEAHRVYPTRPSRGQGSTRAILERAVVHIPDVEVDPEYKSLGLARLIGWRSGLFVPMLREGAPIGVIMVARAEAAAFSDNEIELLKTFADQAVIAVENVRLFKELEGRNRDLTATGEILRVISTSPTDVQPVFDTIVRSAMRLCDAVQSNVQLFDGELMHWVAQQGVGPEAMESIRRVYPMRPDQSQTASRAILTRIVVHLPDVLDDPEYRHELALKGGWRGVLSVPMIRQGDPIGAITVARLEPGAFSETQQALLQTFAAQAVIAIENVRLFKELEARTADLTRSVDQLTALGEVGRAVSSTLDIQTVLDTIVARAVQLSRTSGGFIYEYDDATEQFHLRASHQVEEELVEAVRSEPIRLGEGATGRAAATRAPVQVPNALDEREYTVTRIRSILVRLGYQSILAVPLLLEQRILGALVVQRREAGTFASETVTLLQTFATQSALAIENARLFREIADKGRELEAASRHKSEFLANMSHELRTPLNAVIGFSEVLLQRMFGALNDKQDEYLKDIYASGQHLLSLINDILDLSKIEAGRMELTPAPFHVPSALENAVTLVRERASRHGIALQLDIDPRIGEMVGDERKIKQVLLNLLSNAVKFTPEGGRISLKASRTDGTVEIAVTDTGIGIAPEDQAAIFEEFRQVGTDDARKLEGTGLGLTLAKKFVELHGGRIWVESKLGTGSTFTFTLPVS